MFEGLKKKERGPDWMGGKTVIDNLMSVFLQSETWILLMEAHKERSVEGLYHLSLQGTGLQETK